jgi:taurine dioxygenase
MKEYKITAYGSGRIGALVEGLDLNELDEETFSILYKQWLQYKVLFFRDQSHLTAKDFAKIAHWWGVPEKWNNAFDTPSYNDEIVPEVHIVPHDYKKPGLENMWHTDTSWLNPPPKMVGNLLIEVPELGSDTLYADTNAMYENLPDAIKTKIHGLYALHASAKAQHPKTQLMVTEKQEEKQVKKESQHPIVIVHPETGKYHLFVQPWFVDSIVGLDRDESDTLLRFLYESNFPEFQCRHSWQKGDVGMWDNRAVIHYACSSYWPHTRDMYRVMVFDKDPSPFEMAPKILLGDDIQDTIRLYQGGVKRFRMRTQFNKGIKFK